MAVILLPDGNTTNTRKTNGKQGPTSSDGQGHHSLRWLGLIFDSGDKEALFFRALKVFNPAAAVGGRIAAEDFRQGKWDNLMAQFERSAEQVTTNLPMLRRFKEEYEGAFFSPDEIGVLREECQKVRSCTNDLQAISALEKLIQACNEALKKTS